MEAALDPEPPKPQDAMTLSFIRDARKVHGDRYDYSKSDYVRGHYNITIICSIHGEFQQLPRNHLKGHGCRLCGLTIGKTKLTKSNEEFIKDATHVHGNSYSYEKINYSGAHKRVIITCPTHEDFQQTPTNHLGGKGCPLCRSEHNSILFRKTLIAFIQEAKNKHANLYDYSKVIYNGQHVYVTIVCKIHGEFQQSPKSHLKGSGCQECSYDQRGLSRTKTTEQFIQDAILVHQTLYDYSKTKYVGSTDRIIIICKTHGEFLQSPAVHLSGGGCRKCANDMISAQRVKSLEQFILDAENVHNKLYEYSMVNYVNSHTNIIINCKKHGDFEQTPNSHLSGSGCPKCAFKTESMVMEFLNKHDIFSDQQFSPNWLNNINGNSKKRRFDIAIHLTKTIIEIDGGQHFKQVRNWGSPEFQRRNDVDKMLLALEHGYSVVRLFQEDIYNQKWNWQKFILDQLSCNRDEPEIIYQDSPLYKSHDELFWQTAFERYTL
jgi:hypothetical protein